MGHIFISYSHKDKAYVHRLQDALQKEGFDVWVDDRIDYGKIWPRVIQEQLDSSDALIVVMTQNSFDSFWVQNELERARQKRKPIFTLLLDGDVWLSVQILQYADVRDKRLPPKDFYDRLAKFTPRNMATSLSEQKFRNRLFDVLQKVPKIAASISSKVNQFMVIVGIIVMFVIALLFFQLLPSHNIPPVPTKALVATFQITSANSLIPISSLPQTFIYTPSEISTETPIPPTFTLTPFLHPTFTETANPSFTPEATSTLPAFPFYAITTHDLDLFGTTQGLLGNFPWLLRFPAETKIQVISQPYTSLDAPYYIIVNRGNKNYGGYIFDVTPGEWPFVPISSAK